MENKLYQTKITIDKHCLDLLLTEAELIEAHARATTLWYMGQIITSL